ncbi:STAS domain-containing protein [Mucilaginibacter sp. Bleaf8]|uniref:STAS domain-containing protein n=1 Tax=Mucilaginibacter sp. Bleaf8 TaxID=2834430 RepID=UPI001BCB9666|nr:STAS domain-containing protein [Mucilaginibacter sp. Bleaf8]MBS7566792.1 STAS domain-containing protein [Mucilaginibacter sp. Bleaf8]
MSFEVRLDSVSENTAKIFLEGSLIVRDAAAIQAELLTILRTYSRANIHLQNIERIDVAGLQLLSALKKSVEVEGKRIQLLFEPDEYLQRVLALSGFTHLVSKEKV